ncbi:LytR family transcriptional regulator [Leptolyngbya sp. 'hensonii']|uniref:LCP family protein n=1 Tax=Leptolyngbya sp. 'hensonii' TaxID=1922337 RepID=UPI00094FF3A1|nr:LCP family protein [Leptolyngbya sp. 'hensonii']OLP20191.1 LytR family transcriptional regulator [Leptolyngbya sp. 'hensonii']
MSAQKISKSRPINPGKSKAVQPRNLQASRGKSARKGGNLNWVWLLFGMTGVAMLSATAGALLAVTMTTTPLMQRQLTPKEAAIFSQDEQISKNQGLSLPELTRPVNILVLGIKVLTTDVDNPPPEAKNLRYQATINSFEGLSDTMLLLRFNPQTKKMVALSIPRDTRTTVEGYGVTKINEANADGGPALSAKATSELLGGVGIDRYVRINVFGVEKLIDALGGVTVYVPQDMKYQDDSQHLYINLKAGRQHLNGDQALQLLRFRYDGNGDIGRIQRQQMVMRALMEQALNPGTIAKLPQILSIIQSHIDTNLSVEELIALVGFAARTNRSNVQMLMLPGTFSTPAQYQASYWLPDPQKIDRMVGQYFKDENSTIGQTLNPAYLKIAIQDSTGQAKAVQSLMDSLGKAGYTDVLIDRTWSEPLVQTRIVAQQGSVEDAEALRRALGFGEVRTESTGNLQSDITIQLGQDILRRTVPQGSRNP